MSNKLNFMMIQDPREVTQGLSPHHNSSWSTSETPQQILQKWKDADINAIGVGAGRWKINGGVTTQPFGHSEWLSWINELIGYAESYNIKVFPFFYGGDPPQYPYGVVDTLPIENRLRMVASVESLMKACPKAAGYMDDLEGWYVNQDYSVARDNATYDWWKKMSDKLHSMNKISCLYAGVQSHYTRFDTLLPSWNTQDFVLFDLNPTEEYHFWSAEGYNSGLIVNVKELLGDTKIVPYLLGRRTSTVKHISDMIPAWTNEQNLSSNVIGFAVWCYTYLDEDEWDLWRNWDYKKLVTSTPIPTPTPAQSSFSSIMLFALLSLLLIGVVDRA